MKRGLWAFLLGAILFITPSLLAFNSNLNSGRENALYTGNPVVTPVRHYHGYYYHRDWDDYPRYRYYNYGYRPYYYQPYRYYYYTPQPYYYSYPYDNYYYYPY